MTILKGLYKVMLGILIIIVGGFVTGISDTIKFLREVGK